MKIGIKGFTGSESLPLHLDPHQSGAAQADAQEQIPMLVPKKPPPAFATLRAVFARDLGALIDQRRIDKSAQHAAKNVVLSSLTSQHGQRAAEAFERHGYRLNEAGGTRKNTKPLTERSYHRIVAELKKELGHEVRTCINKVALMNGLEGAEDIFRSAQQIRPSHDFPTAVRHRLETITRELAAKRCDLMASGHGEFPKGKPLNVAFAIYDAARKETIDLYRRLHQEGVSDENVLNAITAAIEKSNSLKPLSLAIPSI